MFRSALAAMLLFAGLAHGVLAAGDHMAVFTKEGSFEDVRDAVDMAITGQGLVVNNVSHVGEMLERTGQVVAGAKRIFLKAEALEFCSVVVSRNMMEADPDNIVFCPYIITVYVVPEKPHEVRVAYRKPQLVGSQESQKALKAVDDLLSGIVKEALQ
ncbi:MAG: DUF302 domain-containing protein [Gallionella sp.]|nr:DUF302 domain-containing protein [Gallionella sp.]